MDPSDWMKKSIIVYQKLQQMGVTVEAGDQVKDTLTMLPKLYQPVECVVTAQLDGGSDITMQALTTLLENFWKKNNPNVVASGEETVLLAKPRKGKIPKRRKVRLVMYLFRVLQVVQATCTNREVVNPRSLNAMNMVGLVIFLLNVLHS